MASKISLLVSALVVIFELFVWVTADIFTALTEMEPLLETHKRIIDDLDSYITKKKKRLFTLQKHLKRYKTEHNKAMEDIPNYLGNPINAFTLMKRLTTDKEYIEHSIQLDTEYVKKINMTHEGLKYPTYEDLMGAAEAFVRLQRTYRLQVKELSAGKINGVNYSSPMSAGDCFELGRGLFKRKLYVQSVFWMKEALDNYRNETDDYMYPFKKIDILEYISFSYYLMGNVKYGLEWTKKLLEIEPSHLRAQGNVPRYEEIVERRMSKSRREEIKKADLHKVPEENSMPFLGNSRIYEAHCRGEMDVPKEISLRLKCWYVTENHPFLRLAPLKVEQMYIEPDVFVFHQVISDDEIEFIKESAKPKLKRAMIYDIETGTYVPSHRRISKVAWLRDKESPVIARVSQRVADMTGLTIDSAEDLQVLNYGIGGHYVPHHDFTRMCQKNISENEDKRIATVLFYMSDVAQGGATVFPELGVTVFPEKNAALFWMNLHPSGEGNMATKHAGCPVLRGSKWVCTKWLHQTGQEFIKPCNLECQEEGTVKKILKPIPKIN